MLKLNCIEMFFHWYTSKQVNEWIIFDEIFKQVPQLQVKSNNEYQMNFSSKTPQKCLKRF